MRSQVKMHLFLLIVSYTFTDVFYFVDSFNIMIQKLLIVIPPENTEDVDWE